MFVLKVVLRTHNPTPSKNISVVEDPERTTDHGQATIKHYHFRLRVEWTLFCNIQSRVRTHAVLVIGLYELLGNPTTQLIEPPGPSSE